MTFSYPSTLAIYLVRYEKSLADAKALNRESTLDVGEFFGDFSVSNTYDVNAADMATRP